MGEVYRARDARLGRDVAIKVLPAGVSADPDRLRRFDQSKRFSSPRSCRQLKALSLPQEVAGASSAAPREPLRVR
jgi:serine/threonine protein kinase